MENYMDEKDMFISFYEWRTKRRILKPRNCSKKALEPCSIKPICCSVQTLSISDLGKEIGKLKKFIKEQEEQDRTKRRASISNSTSKVPCPYGFKNSRNAFSSENFARYRI
jgi:hypothetical protein